MGYAARERVAAWLTANGIDPLTVPQQSVEIAASADGTRVIRYFAHPPGSDGHIREQREVPLTAEFDGGPQ